MIIIIIQKKTDLKYIDVLFVLLPLKVCANDKFKQNSINKKIQIKNVGFNIFSCKFKLIFWRGIKTDLFEYSLLNKMNLCRLYIYKKSRNCDSELEKKFAIKTLRRMFNIFAAQFDIF